MRFEKLHELRFNGIFFKKFDKGNRSFQVDKNYILLLHILHDYTYYDY